MFRGDFFWGVLGVIHSPRHSPARNRVIVLTLGLGVLILAKTGNSKCTCGSSEGLRSKRAGAVDDDDSAGIANSHDHGDTTTDDDELDNLDAELEGLVQRHQNEDVLEETGISKNHGHKMPRYAVGCY